MGYTRPRPARLAEKLLHIRNALGLSQTEMWRRLELEGEVTYDRISKYETGRNEPPLSVLLRYARLANVYLDALVDDALDLPARLPAAAKTEGSRSKSTTKRKRR